MFVRKNAVSEPSSGNKPSILTALLLLPSFRYAYLGGRRGGTPHEYIRLTRATPHMTRCVRLEMAETTRGVGKKGRAFSDGRRRIDSSDRTVRRYGLYLVAGLTPVSIGSGSGSGSLTD